MLLSQALGLNLSQPMLDFVDIDLDLDFPLYIDPAGFLKPRDEFAQRCQNDLRSFFDAVLAAIKKGDQNKGLRLLQGLKEPNETYLGVSKGKPNGRGLGSGQAQQVLDAVMKSRAAQTGLLSDLTDTALFIEGIGADKVSDMTTNIIRRHLITYTQEQFELHKQQIPGKIPTGLLWDAASKDWVTDELDYIPVVNGERVLLVPKRYVRWRGGLHQAAAKYYNNFVTNYIRDDQLATNGKLVEVIKTKKRTRRVVTKKRINKEFPLTKPFLADFSEKHPNEYRKFRNSLDRHGPLGLRKLVEANGKQFNETAFCMGLIATLAKIPTGRRAANDYHHLMTGILTYLFYPDLISPVLELEINDGRKRIDLSFQNSAETGFFKDRKDDPFTQSREVVIECKNYGDDISNPEIDQMAGRLDPRRGRFGMVTCRSIDKPDALAKRLTDVFQAQNGIIFCLTDADIAVLLTVPPLNRDTAIQVMLRAKLREVSK